MGWERREATLEQEGGNGLGVLRKGVRAGGSGPGRAGGAPPRLHSHVPWKGAPSPGTGPGGGRRCCTHARCRNGQFHLPAPPRTPTPLAGRGRGAGSPAPPGSGSGAGGGGNAAPWPCPAGTWGHEYLEIGAAVLREVGEPWEGLRHGQRGRRVPGGMLFMCSIYTRAHKYLFLSIYVYISKITAQPLPVLFLAQLGPAFPIFIVKFVVVVIFLGTSKGLIPLVALSDVMMIYRHSLGKTGILLPGSLKKLCTGSLCFCQARLGCEMGRKGWKRDKEIWGYPPPFHPEGHPAPGSRPFSAAPGFGRG